MAIIYTPELLHELRCCFGHSNLYRWRYKPETMSKSNWRRSDTSRWNNIAEALVRQGLGLERTLNERRFFSPTWEALRGLEEHWDVRTMYHNPSFNPSMGRDAFAEIRQSMVWASSDQERWVIEDAWRQLNLAESREFDAGLSYAYLLPPRATC